MSEALIALMAALFGGAGLKIIEKVLGRNKERVDIATQLRDELRTEIGALKEELRHIDENLDQWKRRYYSLLQHYNDIRVKCASAGVKVEPFTFNGEEEKVE